MKKYKLAAMMAVTMWVGACVPSINPFYTDKDLVFDARLLGEWQENGKTDDADIWKFEKADDKGYTLTVLEKQTKEGKFDARLFKLKEEWYLDIIAADCNYATNQCELVAFSMFPGHLIVHVPQLEPELKLAFFDFDWLAKYLEQNPKSLAHHLEGKTGKEGGHMILTAETRDLQKFVLRHLGGDELFSKPGVMVRKVN